jgi:hypothetical protein
MEAGGSVTCNRRRRRWRLDERAWHGLFKRFDGAGLSVEAFCRREGLSSSTLGRWRLCLPRRPGLAATAVARGPRARSSALSFMDLGLFGGAGVRADPNSSSLARRP